MYSCSSEINWFVPLFPQILFSYIPCSPILSLFPSKLYLIYIIMKLCLICVHTWHYGRHFDDFISRTRGGTQMGELVQIVTYEPKFILV